MGLGEHGGVWHSTVEFAHAHEREKPRSGARTAEVNAFLKRGTSNQIAEGLHHHIGMKSRSIVRACARPVSCQQVARLAIRIGIRKYPPVLCTLSKLLLLLQA